MPWEPIVVNDGDAYDANSINSRLNGAVSWLNAMGGGGLRRGAFGHKHGWKSIRPSLAPLTVGYDGPDSIVYDRATFGNSMLYTTPGAPGGAATPADLTPPVGDRSIVGHPSCAGYGGPTAQIDFDSPGYEIGLVGPDLVGFILVLFNCQIVRVAEGTSPTDTVRIMNCIQFTLQNAPSTWNTKLASERFVSHSDHVLDRTNGLEEMQWDQSVMTVIKRSTVDAITDPTVRVQKIRAMISSQNIGTGSSFTIRRWNLTALPLHAKEG